RRGLAPAPDLDRVVLGLAVRRRGVRGVRHEPKRLVPSDLGRRELFLRGSQLLLEALERLELLGRRLAGQLLAAAEVVDAWDEGAPVLVGGQELVEGAGGTLPLERGPVLVLVRPRGLGVDHP